MWVTWHDDVDDTTRRQLAGMHIGSISEDGPWAVRTSGVGMKYGIEAHGRMAQDLSAGIARAPARLQPARNVVVRMMDANEQSIHDPNFGARDPFEAEIESGFGAKPLGNADTDHIVRPPDGFKALIGLTARDCVSAEELAEQPALDEVNVERLLNQVPGFQLVKDEEPCTKIRQSWRSRIGQNDALRERLAAVAEAQGHPAQISTPDADTVVVELYTPATTSLTVNDFVLAAHMNEADLVDVLPKKKAKFWA